MLRGQLLARTHHAIDMAALTAEDHTERGENKLFAARCAGTALARKDAVSPRYAALRTLRLRIEVGLLVGLEIMRIIKAVADALAKLCLFGFIMNDLFFNFLVRCRIVSRSF